MTWTLPILLLIAVPALAQTPATRMLNTSRPGSQKLEVGDRFEIFITAPPKQPISVRTARQGRIDWGPIVGSTDSTGRWSTAGRFDKSDFGDWSEVWTVGSKIAAPTIQFQVNAPCLPKGENFASSTGLHFAVTCETPEGRQTFHTPSDSDPFRTPDGRWVLAGGHADQTQEAYHTGILQHFICSPEPAKGAVALHASQGGLGDGTADLILKLIGVNALNAAETRNVLALLRGAFERPETIAPDKRVPANTERLLQRLKDLQPDLEGEITATAMYVRAR